MSEIQGTDAAAGWSRRRFALAACGTSAAVLAAANAIGQTTVPLQSIDERRPQPLTGKNQTVLFQGDSITDAGRNRDAADANAHAALGGGYAWLAACELLVDRPDDRIRIFNRGVSGDKVYQLAERWETDCLALKPNVLSILVGVNDFWHKLKNGYDGTLEKYADDYRNLINRTKVALPDVRLVICEPFVLRVGAVDDSWFPEFDGYRVAVKKLAEDVQATFVPFQTMFDAAVKIAPPETWAADGVHPTADGAALMAHAWLKAIGA